MTTDTIVKPAVAIQTAQVPKAGSMTPRQRMLCAMTGGTPDRVPASPDTNWMIPARLKGGKFWDVYYYGQPPIWKAYPVAQKPRIPSA